jgi:hypothetical protein
LKNYLQIAQIFADEISKSCVNRRNLRILKNKKGRPEGRPTVNCVPKKSGLRWSSSRRSAAAIVTAAVATAATAATTATAASALE